MRMRISEPLLSLIAGSLLLLSISSITASAGDTKSAESIVPRLVPRERTDCAEEPQRCQGARALLLNEVGVSPLSLASQRNDYLPTGIAGSKQKNAEGEPKELQSSKPATNGKWLMSYVTAAVEAVEPSVSETVKPKSAETLQPHWSNLPIWGSEAEARGHRIPLPFGIGVTYYDARQPVNVRDLKLGVGRGPTESATFAKVGAVSSWQQNVSSRFDVWPLPFFNLYGVAGYTKGNTRGVVSVTGPVFGILNEDLPLLAEFHGPTFGGGVTLAGGFKITEWRDLHAFMVADANHTITNLSFKDETLISHTRPQATVAAVRFGLRGEVTEYIYTGIWVGAMFQRIQEEVAGSVAGRELEFIINQRAASPWNTLIGGQIELGKHFNIIVEGGIGPRSSILTGTTFRF